MTTDVIIPARSESLDTLAPTVAALRGTDLCGRVIVVTRNVRPEVWDWCTQNVDVVIPAPRDGKGQAVMQGLERVTTKRVAFCDADLMHFNKTHAEILCEEYDDDEMVLGVTEYIPRTYVPWDVNTTAWVMVTGERSLPVSLLNGLDLHGYCMEAQINNRATERGMWIQPLSLVGCYGIPRWSTTRANEMRRDWEWFRNHRRAS